MSTSGLLQRSRRVILRGRHGSYLSSIQTLTTKYKEDNPRKLKFASDEKLSQEDLPSKAKIVICGGGAQGAAIAYKLAQRGLGSETVIIDKGEFGRGSTLHSSGLIPLLKSSPVETKLSKISKALYLELEDAGYYTGWTECGSLYLGQTKERLQYFKRMKSNAVGRNVSCELVTPDRIKDLCPIINTDDLKGGLWVPGDGLANPFEICLALAVLARNMGVRIISNCEVNKIMHERGNVTGILTNQGYIECENFVNAAGLWARYVGTLSYPRVQIPMHPAEHYILHTQPIRESKLNIPVVRDPDGHIYFKENNGRILCGGFEKVSKPAYNDGVMPTEVSSGDIPLDWDHFHGILESFLKRLPFLQEYNLEKLTNDPEPYSADGEWILGESVEIRNYYVAAAMRSSGVGAAGGVGELIADYITEGRTPFDMLNLDVQRFLPIHNNRKFLTDRVQETPGRLFSIPYPFLEYQTGRALRTSPIFTILKDAGARFNQVMGYERPMYFEPDKEISLNWGIESLVENSDRSKLSVAKSNTFFKPPWFDLVREEFAASREACSLCDYSSFAKIDIWSRGDEVVEFLQKMCSMDIDVPIGEICHTGMQNEQGGYQNDCTLARLAQNRYMMMSPSIQQMRSFFWMKTHLPENGSVFLEDVTSLYTSLCLMGPNSKKVMQKLTTRNLNEIPNFTVTYLDIKNAPDVLTMTLTHTGELGYVFYIPNEVAVHVMESIMAAGKEHGIKHCGYYAMRALRLEKFYAFWGQDLDSHSTPLECGRSFRTKINTDIDFIGRDALAKQQAEGIKKMLVMLLFDYQDHDSDMDPWPWGGEPIFRNGKYVGTTTTSSYGFSLKKHIAIGFIHNFDANGNKDFVTVDYVKKGDYEIELAGIRYPVAVKLTSPTIPKNVTDHGGYEETTKHE